MQETLRPRPAKAQLETFKRRKLATCGCATACLHEIRAHVRALEEQSRHHEVGPAFRRALQEARIPEKEAAARLGISQQRLSSWILGGATANDTRAMAVLGTKFKCAFLTELFKTVEGVSVSKVIHVPEVATA